MANPQIDEGKFLIIANEIAEALAKINLSPYESRVLWAVFRKTYGWRKKADRIAFSQFEELAGLKRQYASRAMKSLIARNIIFRQGSGHKLSYGLQKNYELWKDAQTSSPEVTSEHKTKAKVSPPKETNEPAQAQTSSPEVETSPPEETKTSSPEGHTKEKKDTLQKTDILSVFDFWNSLKIIVHDTMTSAIETAIKNALINFGKVKVMQAMTNYGQLLHGDYEWTYKWTLQEFLSRGGGNNIERFKDMEVLRQNYGKRQTNAANRGNPRKLPQAGGYTRPENYGKS